MSKQKEYFATKNDIEEIMSKHIGGLKTYMDENFVNKVEFKSLKKSMHKRFNEVERFMKTVLFEEVGELKVKVTELIDNSKKESARVGNIDMIVQKFKKYIN